MAMIDPDLTKHDIQPNDVIRLCDPIEIGYVDIFGRIAEATVRWVPVGTRLLVHGFDNDHTIHCSRLDNWEVINIDLEDDFDFDVEYRQINFPERYARRLL